MLVQAKIVAVGLTFVGLVLFNEAQHIESDPLPPGNPLTISRTLETGEPPSSIVLPAKCDLHGNVFVRVHQGKTGAGPVLRISQDGKRIQRFTIERIEAEVRGARIRSISTDTASNLYMVLDSPDSGSFLAFFDSDGKYLAHHRLDGSVRASQIAVFGSGNILVAGQEVHSPEKLQPEDVRNTNPAPFTALFSSTGQLVRRVQLRDDVEPQSTFAEALGGERYAKPDRDFERAIVLSTAEMGDDGNIYFMRHAPTGPVYQILPSGKTGRRFVLRPPAGASLTDIKVSKGLMTAVYITNNPPGGGIKEVSLVVLSLATGNEVGRYAHSNPFIGSVLACAAPGRFTFLGTDQQGRLTLVETRPE